MLGCIKVLERTEEWCVMIEKSHLVVDKVNTQS